MLLTITTTERPATDLGYLLHKNPARLQSFELTFGRAHVFYPEVSDERCTAALFVEVDPVGLVRGRRGDSGLEQYVNDRPYVASSFLGVAIGEVLGTALSGRSKERPELAERAIPLVARLPVVPCRGGDAIVRRLFEPLGYTVTATRIVLDELHPEWGEGPYFALELAATKRLSELLAQLSVLVSVLDARKHYWVGDDEVEKLLRRGEGWLAAHPEREMIALRYLKHRRSLARDALERLVAEEVPEVDETTTERAEQEESLERKISLNEQRLGAVVAVLKQSGAQRVLDLGCGEGKLLARLLAEAQFTEIVGVDVSLRSLDIAEERLHLERMAERQRARIRLVQGSLTYRDERLAGYDAAAVVEVIEHLDPPRLPAFERALFESSRPGTVVITTPNAEHNVRFATLAAGKMRHADHRFEWTRAEFESWANGVAERHAYRVRFLPVGDVDATVGPPTQMAVFVR